MIENTQRDVNIALINELALIFDRLGIDTQDVLDAAGTKWNFLPFRPGLVGGHCIGVDPVLPDPQGAASSATIPKSSCRPPHQRRHGRATWRAQVMQLMAHKRHPRRRRAHPGARPHLQGKLPGPAQHPRGRHRARAESRECQVDVHDPWADPTEARQELGITPIDAPAEHAYDAIVLAVAHRDFLGHGDENIRRYGRENCVVFDIKSLLPAGAVDGRL